MLLRLNNYILSFVADEFRFPPLKVAKKIEIPGIDLDFDLIPTFDEQYKYGLKVILSGFIRFE